MWRTDRVLIMGLVVIALGLAACGTSVAPSSTTRDRTEISEPASPSDEPTATPSPVAERTPFEVTVGDLSIAGHCSGTRNAGEPAVVLQHGNGGSQDHLSDIEAYLAETALVCAYDRPGGRGRSDVPTSRPRSVIDVAHEAQAVLAAADIQPPYFLIGQSAGAAIAIVHAHLYPTDVAGFVASNPNPPFTAWIEAASKVESPEEIESLEMPDYRGENPEAIDMRPNDIMLEPLPDDMPFAILFDEDCGGIKPFCDRILEPLAATQELLAGVGAGGRFLWVDGAGHEIPFTRPEVMRETIEEVWAEVIDN